VPVLKDIRFALRMLRRSPGFTAMALVVLALGIGANTAIFSLVNAVLLEPLPFRNPSQLVRMYETERAPGNYPLSGPDFPDWKTQSRLFADMTLINYARSMNLTGGGEPARVIVQPAESNYFQLLGVQPALGRMLQPAADEAAPAREAVLSYSAWKSRFGGETAAVGRSITLDGAAYTVVGVAPASFNLDPSVQLWVPLAMNASGLGQRGNHSFMAIGRLKAGVTVTQGQSEIAAIAARLEKQYPASNTDTGARIFPLRDRLVGASQRASLLTLLWVVGLVLLIACANLANMLLARALGRQKEISIRLALGASRGRILRQLLTESVLLALAGAAGGAVLAELGVRAVLGLKAFTLPQFNPIHVDATVLAFTAGLAVAAGILFGLAPAWQLSRPRINDQLSGAGALAGGHRKRWLSDSLIVAEVALSLLLLVGAGLFIQSFSRLRSSNIGIQPEGVLTAAVNLPEAGYKAPQVQQFERNLLDRLRAIPGATQVSLTGALPLEGQSNGYITLAGQTTVEQALVEWNEVSEGYFKTFQIPFVHGADYTSADLNAWNRLYTAYAAEHMDMQALNSQTLPVIVNRAMVDHFYPGKDPIGQRFRRGGDGPWLTIKGVVDNVAVNELGEAPFPQAYFPMSGLDNAFHLAVRSSLPPAAIAEAMRNAVSGLDANLPLYDVRSMDQLADASVAGQAFQKWLMTGFAGLALLLAIAGIYGVMAYLVAARTREIGVRVALGASRGSVLSLVLGRGMALAGAGAALGLVLAVLLGRLIASQLYQVQPADPVTLAVGAVVLLAACLLASYIPARRAASVQPSEALRIS
jgi:putative ABC transport system permease protein